MTQYIVLDNNQLIKGIYPYFGLINIRYDLADKKPFYIVPVKNIAWISQNQLRYDIIPKNKKWQAKIIRHFNNKIEMRNYNTITNNSVIPVYYTIKNNFKQAKEYRNLPVQHKDIQKQKYRRTKRHSTFSWRTLKHNRLHYNVLYNSYCNRPKMRHPNRKLDANLDRENWNTGNSTGWKQRKIKHQYLVHVK